MLGFEAGRRAASFAAVVVVALGMLAPIAMTDAAHASEPLGAVHVVVRTMHDPYALTAGPDGNVWFRHHDDSIGRITPAGVITLFAAAGALGQGGIAAGPDGNVWYTSATDHLVGRITPAGVVTTFSDPSIGAPGSIITGPDGNLWFLDEGDDSVGTITPAGVVTDHPLLPGMRVGTCCVLSDAPIAVDADGVWFAVEWGELGSFARAVARLTPTGALTILPVSGASIIDLVVGPDANLWFTTALNTVVRLTPEGVETTFPGPDLAAYAPFTRGIAVGPDGALWVTNDGHTGPEWITRFGTDGAVLGTFTDQANGAGDITTGADGNVWFTNDASRPEPGVDQAGYLASMTPAGVGTRHRDDEVFRPATIAAHATDGAWVRDASDLWRVHADGSAARVAVAVGAVATGPDGTTWYSRYGVGAAVPSMVHVAPDGATTTFELTGTPDDLGVDAAGNVWFIAGTDVVRMTPAGAIHVVGSLGDPQLTDVHVVPAPDGSVWVSASKFKHFTGLVGRMTPGGVLTFTSIESRSMAVGPDGNLWISTLGAEVTRLLPSGTATSFAVPFTPGVITSGPDGALWIASAAIWRLTTAGAVVPVVALRAPAGGLTAGPDGRVWFTQPDTGTISSIATTPVPDPGFSDVPATSPFHDDIAWLVDAGLATGGPGTFRPTAPVSRQALAAFLYRRAGSPDGPDPACGAPAFVDVPVDDPFCGEIAWFHAAGWSTGYDDGTFRPTAPVTRQAMAAFLSRSAGASIDGLCRQSRFDDVTAAQPFCDQIVWLDEHGITTGYGARRFRPEAAVSRQAMAAFLHRLAVVVGS